MKHFRLREDLFIEQDGIRLFRIEATKDIERRNVKAGELGGYIEKEDNLSGDAWVYSDAKVYGDASVFGNAEVSGDARVFGRAWVYGYAKVGEYAGVCGTVEVYGNATVRGTAMVRGDAKVYEDAEVCGDALVCGNAEVCGNVKVVSAADCRNIINERYNVTILPEHMHIGCQLQKKQDWWGFSDRKILGMGGKHGLEWWKKWKPILMAICETEIKSKNNRLG